MFYYRIEVKLPLVGDFPSEDVPMDWKGAAAYRRAGVYMTDIGLPLPDRSKFDRKSFFWFTQKGWDTYGIEIYSFLIESKLRHPWLDVRVIMESSLDSIEWSDQWQVAAKDDLRFAEMLERRVRAEEIHRRKTREVESKNPELYMYYIECEICELAYPVIGYKDQSLNDWSICLCKDCNNGIQLPLSIIDGKEAKHEHNKCLSKGY